MSTYADNAVTYRNTDRDMLWLAIHRHVHNGGWGCFGVAYLTLSVVLSIAFTAGSVSEETGRVQIAIVFVLILGMFIFIYGFLAAFYAHLALRVEGGALGRHTVSLTEASLVDETASGRTETPWTSVHKAAVGRGRLLVYLTPRQALLIPRRAFKGEAQRTVFCKFLSEKVPPRS